MPRIDLHTHSTASPDGGLSAKDYARMLTSGRLNTIAVTDHDRIDFAVELQRELGNAIIIGEEITAQEGEIVGLYLSEVVPAGLSAIETMKHIHKQGGLVYIPHPFETARKGLPLETLNQVAALVDIVEVYNGRTMQNRAKRAKAWAVGHHTSGASSSDAHGPRGWGKTASIIAEQPTSSTLIRLLDAATHSTASTGLTGRLYPKYNRLIKRGNRA